MHAASSVGYLSCLLRPPPVNSMYSTNYYMHDCFISLLLVNYNNVLSTFKQPSLLDFSICPWPTPSYCITTNNHPLIPDILSDNTWLPPLSLLVRIHCTLHTFMYYNFIMLLPEYQLVCLNCLSTIISLFPILCVYF